MPKLFDFNIITYDPPGSEHVGRNITEQAYLDSFTLNNDKVDDFRFFWERRTLPDGAIGGGQYQYTFKVAVLLNNVDGIPNGNSYNVTWIRDSITASATSNVIDIQYNYDGSVKSNLPQTYGFTNPTSNLQFYRFNDSYYGMYSFLFSNPYSINWGIKTPGLRILYQNWDYDYGGNPNKISSTHSFSFPLIYPTLFWTENREDMLEGVQNLFDNYPRPFTPSGSDDNTKPGGGNGDYNNTSDDITLPDINVINGNSVLSTNMISTYRLTSAQIKDFATFLWSNNFFDAVVKILQNPIEAILMLSLMPLTVGTQEQVIVLGNVFTPVSGIAVTQQFITIDCGALTVNEFWGSALDYNPYTKIQIYLPFIGTKNLSCDDCMRGSISVKYVVDIVSGACVAFITCARGNLNSVVYQYSGNVASQLPITATNMSQFYQTLLSTSVATATAITGGTAAPVLAALPNSMMGLKSNGTVERSGRFDSTIGYMSQRKPYLIITRPRQSLPTSFNDYKGYTSNITVQLSECKGYTEVAYIHLDGLDATEDEIREIESLLHEGVYIN